MAKTTYGGAAKTVMLPPRIVKALKLVEGDELQVTLRDSSVLLMPKKAIPKGQEWFWTPEHQAKEREADEAIRAGRVSGPFKTKEEIRAHFAKIEKQIAAKKKSNRRNRA